MEPGRQTFLVRFDVKMKSLAMMVLNKNASLDPHLMARASERMYFNLRHVYFSVLCDVSNYDQPCK